MRNERTTQGRNATTETTALHGLRTLDGRGLLVPAFAEIPRRNGQGGRMHTKQTSEGELDMTRNWMNPLPHRLLCWMGLQKSPSLGRRPTLKEALTGNAPPMMSQKEWDEYFERLDEMLENYREVEHDDTRKGKDD